MVDIFVVTALSGMVTFDSFQIVAGTGATAYVLMVFFTLAAAIAFDPRLIARHYHTQKSKKASDNGIG